MSQATPEALSVPSRRLDLIEQYRLMHLQQRGYGASSERQCGYIQVALDSLGPIGSILDYGCGRSRLVDWLARLNGATPYRYDPAIAEHSTLPTGPFDLVVNTDVLEHIDEQDLDDVLSEISSLSKNVYFNIATARAAAVLPSGENAHCTVRPDAWWHEKLVAHFPCLRPTEAWKPQRCSFVTWPAR